LVWLFFAGYGRLIKMTRNNETPKAKAPENKSAKPAGGTAPKSDTKSKKPTKLPEDILCSFCGKPSNRAKQLIAGPNNIFICDECLEICVTILLEESPFDWNIRLLRLIANPVRNTILSFAKPPEKKKKEDNK
jgi:hypothetical protein